MHRQQRNKKIGKSYIYWNRHRGIKDFLQISYLYCGSWYWCRVCLSSAEHSFTSGNRPTVDAMIWILNCCSMLPAVGLSWFINHRLNLSLLSNHWKICQSAVCHSCTLFTIVIAVSKRLHVFASKFKPLPGRVFPAGSCNSLVYLDHRLFCYLIL